MRLYICRLLKAKELENAKVTFAALEQKLDVMLRLLGNEDDDVSGAVAPFAHDYMTLLKQVLPLSDNQKATVKVRIEQLWRLHGV